MSAIIEITASVVHWKRILTHEAAFSLFITAKFSIPQVHYQIVSEILRGTGDTYIEPIEPSLCCSFLPVHMIFVCRNGQLSQSGFEKIPTIILEYPLIKSRLKVSLGFLEVTQDLNDSQRAGKWIVVGIDSSPHLLFPSFPRH